MTITSEGAGRPIGSTVFSVGKSNLIRHRPKMKGWEMKTIGFDQPLYILPFDHRGSFETKMHFAFAFRHNVCIGGDDWNGCNG